MIRISRRSSFPVLPCPALSRPDPSTAEGRSVWLRLLLVGLIAGCSSPAEQPDVDGGLPPDGSVADASADASTSSDASEPDAAPSDANVDAAGPDAAVDVTLEVTVPENTPDSDVVTVDFGGGNTRAMTPTGPRTWEIQVDSSDVGDGTVCYRYNRNDSNYLGSDYLTPDTNNDYFTGCLRSFDFSPGLVVTDTVTRWRWFPPDGTDPTPLPYSSVPTVVARDSGQPLRIGVALQDLYFPFLDALFAPTAARLAGFGFGVVDIEPAWHALSVDPLPVLGPDYDNSPDYTEAGLRAQIQANRSQEITVMVSPQVYPMIDFSGTHTTEWWDAWFEQYGTFLVTEAQIAEDEGATDFSFRPDGLAAENPPADADARWRALLARVRAVFSGRIGLRFYGFSDNGTPGAFPDVAGVTFADALDFTVIVAVGSLSADPDANDDALLAGAAGIVDLAQPLGLPAMIQGVYASVAQSWRGSEFYSISLATAPWNGEDQWQAGTYSFDEVAQARAHHALLRAIASRSWVDSYLAWGYWNQDMPRAPGPSIRAKVAERLLRLWVDSL